MGLFCLILDFLVGLILQVDYCWWATQVYYDLDVYDFVVVA